MSGSLRQLTPPSSQENQPVTTTKPSTVPTVTATTVIPATDITQTINHGMLLYIPFQKRYPTLPVSQPFPMEVLSGTDFYW